MKRVFATNACMNDRESPTHTSATLIGYIADAVVCAHEVSKSRDLSISPCCQNNDKWETLSNTFLLPVMPRLTTNERHRAAVLLEGGVGIRQVARMMGCSPQTIINLRRRYQETNSVDDRPRPCAERVTTPDQDRYIVLQYFRDRFRTAVQTAAETPGTHQERISPTTIQRRLHDNDLRAHRPSIGNVLTPLRRQNRHQGARRHLNWNQRQWNNFVFYDELRFCQYRHDGRQRVWRR